MKCPSSTDTTCHDTVYTPCVSPRNGTVKRRGSSADNTPFPSCTSCPSGPNTVKLLAPISIRSVNRTEIKAGASNTVSPATGVYSTGVACAKASVGIARTIVKKLSTPVVRKDICNSVLVSNYFRREYANTAVPSAMSDSRIATTISRSAVD